MIFFGYLYKMFSVKQASFTPSKYQLIRLSCLPSSSSDSIVFKHAIFMYFHVNIVISSCPKHTNNLNNLFWTTVVAAAEATTM